MLKQIAQALVKGIRNTENVFRAISMVMFFVLMTVGAFDVIGRYVFNRPIVGTLELSQHLIVGLVVLSWAYAQMKGAHIRMEIVVSHLSSRIQAILGFLTRFLSLVLFSTIAWQATILAMEYWRGERYIARLNIPTASVQFLVLFGAFLISLELIIQMLHLLLEMRKAN